MTNEEYSNLYAKQHARYERRAYPIFLKALHEQITPTLKWITENQSVEVPLDALVVPAIWRTPMVEVYEMIGMLAAKREYFFMRDAEKGVLDFLVAKWREIFYFYSINYAYRIENELSETTKEEIRRALTTAYELNLNTDQTAALIRKQVYNQISRSRAVMIARTETNTAASLGKMTGGKSWLEEQGQKGYKEFIGRADERERHTHFELNNDIIPIDEPFKFGTEYAQYPGDVTLSAGERINCRCTFLIMSQRRYERIIAGRNTTA